MTTIPIIPQRLTRRIKADLASPQSGTRRFAELSTQPQSKSLPRRALLPCHNLTGPKSQNIIPGRNPINIRRMSSSRKVLRYFHCTGPSASQSPGSSSGISIDPRLGKLSALGIILFPLVQRPTNVVVRLTRIHRVP